MVFSTFNNLLEMSKHSWDFLILGRHFLSKFFTDLHLKTRKIVPVVDHCKTGSILSVDLKKKKTSIFLASCGPGLIPWVDVSTK